MSKDWSEEFDNLFEGIDAWVYMNPTTDPKGISSKVMDGKKYIKSFISSLLTEQREELIEEIKRILTQNLPSPEFVNEGYTSGYIRAMDIIEGYSASLSPKIKEKK